MYFCLCGVRCKPITADQLLQANNYGAHFELQAFRGVPTVNYIISKRNSCESELFRLKKSELFCLFIWIFPFCDEAMSKSTIFKSIFFECIPKQDYRDITTLYESNPSKWLRKMELRPVISRKTARKKDISTKQVNMNLIIKQTTDACFDEKGMKRFQSNTLKIISIKQPTILLLRFGDSSRNFDCKRKIIGLDG